MIISHKHNFIFIKTRKTAGSSVELYLENFCGPDDIISPAGGNDPCKPRNYKGFYNPIPEIIFLRKTRYDSRLLSLMKFSSHRFLYLKKYLNHVELTIIVVTFFAIKIIIIMFFIHDIPPR